MGSCVWSDETPDRAGETDHTGETGGLPATAVVEVGEDFRRWRTVCHNPERDEEGEEREDMREKDDALRKWQLVCGEDIEADA